MVTEAIRHTGAKILDDNIGACHQTLNDGEGFRVFQIDGDAALIAVESHERHTFAAEILIFEGKPPHPITAGGFDLHYFRAKIAKNLRRIGTL